MSKSKYKHTFVIDRSLWLSGDTEIKFGPQVFSQMKDTKGRMCCLGFYCNSLGVKGMVKYVDSHPGDVGLRGALPKQASWLVQNSFSGLSSAIANKLVIKNDSHKLTNEQREQIIKKLFAKQEIRVVFRGKYPPNSGK